MFLLVVLLVFVGTELSAHSGRTDSKGGHYNRKTGGYHYHGGGTSSSSSSSSSRTSTVQGDSEKWRIIELEKRFAALIERIEELEKKLEKLEKKIGEEEKGEVVESEELDEEEIVQVYVTRTGKKYHREGCYHLSRSRFLYSLKEAKKKFYQPCSVCNPPK